MQDLIAKAATLLEALPYIQRFRSQTFVVKYGGSFMDSPDPAVRNGVARDVVFLEAVDINPVVVHGGGKAITRAMETAGLKANFIQGSASPTTRRWTWWIACCRARSTRRSSRPSKNSAARRGAFAGADIFKCRKLWLDDQDKPGAKIDIGFVGEVMAVNIEPLRECIRRSITPVISPTALRRGREDLQLQRRRGRRAGRHRAQGQAAGVHERRAGVAARIRRIPTRSSRTSKPAKWTA